MVDLRQLIAGVDEFAGRIGISGDEADRKFAAWFAHARLSWKWTPDDARRALTDVPDGGVDAVYVQPDERTVYLLQTKLRQAIRIAKVPLKSPT